ncbi:conserved hypothetical protein (plasmid) [Nitrosococcus halophilus Nc 4]|uniref:Uncharacterized protein n=1 Tax=Nitrosococcus halophilus (strain Nc4) TaxID=472759 RepID=D5C5H1_NITHN|nr:hypothetical protein [Nitrosococcus halophilus]ADE17025.1 conserved hypothetical protein [Nitrosococcus halophilus Nc 4]
MEFTLFYRGELKSNGSPNEKHRIRRALHPQLKYLWELEPLNAYKDWVSCSKKPARSDEKKLCLLEKVGNFTFAPLVSSKIFLATELIITLLRPEQPGNIIIQSGDIDNRLKTLFDALCVPAQENQLPTGKVQEADENPIFCLLEDDRLITSVQVKTDRLLESGSNSKEVVLLIHARTKVTKHVMNNVHFI